MTKKYGVTTIGRWLSEKLPCGIKCYIKCRGLMLELVGVSGHNGTLFPVLRPTGEGRMLQVFTAHWNPIDLNTQVVLSQGDELNCEPWSQVSKQLRPSAPDCWALGVYLATDDATEPPDRVTDSSVYCG